MLYFPVGTDASDRPIYKLMNKQYMKYVQQLMFSICLSSIIKSLFAREGFCQKKIKRIILLQ